ncbi:MAG TPA: SDR family NAD(P)-dependent oxidoreductase [Anaeromyxobacteraceae bacterium]|nr:SDR family NAD(P)-dependent oxidoreductase [Anaeromyxobacteraceae bacterium]
MPRRTALVTGANRGIGLEVCRQLAGRGLGVILTGRSAEGAAAAAEELRRGGLDVAGEVLDVASAVSVDACAGRLARQGVHVDVLVNNAGLYPPGDLLTMSPDAIREAMDVHFFGALWAVRAWVPGMLERGHGRVVNVTSGYGSISEGLEGPAAYAVSKAALNALTIRLAREARGDVKVNAACPGWVRTRMGGSGAPRSVEEGADTIAWLATLPPDGPSGGLFRSRRQIAW